MKERADGLFVSCGLEMPVRTNLTGAETLLLPSTGSYFSGSPLGRYRVEAGAETFLFPSPDSYFTGSPLGRYRVKVEIWVDDYQVDMFRVAMTDAKIFRYGMRGYYFIVGDKMGQSALNQDALVRAFGLKAFTEAFGNANSRLWIIQTLVKKLQENWHIFFLQVGEDIHTRNWWGNLIGFERVVKLLRFEDLLEVEALIIGLTEGTANLLNFTEKIKKSVSDIPVGEQAKVPNFERIPPRGSIFRHEDDLWPIYG